MCPDSPTLVAPNSQENTYGESDDPAFINWKIVERKSQAPEMPSTLGVFDTNSLDRFFKFGIGELAMELSTESAFTQGSIGEQEYFVYSTWMPIWHKMEVPKETLFPPERQQSLAALKQMLSHSFSASTENLPSSDLSELVMIIRIIYSLDSLGYPKCARRIEFLKNYDDFEEGEEPLSLESAQSFLKFVSDTYFRERFVKLGEPALGLSADGTLGADWRIADNKHLLVEFHRNSIVSFAMIGPNSDSPEDGKFRLNGRNTREEVIKILYKQGVANW